MNTVILEVRSLKDTLADATRAMKSGHAEREARIALPRPNSYGKYLPPSDGSCSK